jgi:hypothetical protein
LHPFRRSRQTEEEKDQTADKIKECGLGETRKEIEH